MATGTVLAKRWGQPGPIVATLAGWTVLDQGFSITQFVGVTVVLVAIALGQRTTRSA